jgi:hypothetical protein
MTLLDNYFPFDQGPGETASQTRWRSMARLFHPSGVVNGYANQFAATIANGIVTVQTGAVWVDGFYGESISNKTVSVTGTGMIVARMDPTQRQVFIVYVPNQTTPTQNLTGLWEIPLYHVTSGTTLTDIRQYCTPIPPAVIPPARGWAWRNGAFVGPGGWVQFGFDASNGNFSGATFHCPYAADYLVACQATIHSNAAGDWYNVGIYHNGGLVSWGGSATSTAANQGLDAASTQVIPCNANDTLFMGHASAVAGLTGQPGAAYCYMHVRAFAIEQ